MGLACLWDWAGMGLDGVDCIWKFPDLREFSVPELTSLVETNVSDNRTTTFASSKCHIVQGLSNFHSYS